ncbi:uncharacterized protein PpBr36_10703 [Pyricularia pennisetigena]|uniref:uncharacterized protein n=1 Tax=Pyricularia pennisetigena TaxID=1578925 RepID=UPI0011515355|nr:uncharacterized protein PpBr36_10703 [Pyricularia pennisetigena]TLS21039.1 hypothetical protein PpBr36_10703 [Pyricularia pennisetigena]
MTELDRFCWQYLQLEQRLDYPSPKSLRTEECQSRLFSRLFAPGALPHPPPHRYQLRVLKELVGRIEASIEDWEEHGISDDLATALTALMSQPTPSEATAAQQKSYVTYHLSLLDQPGSSSSSSSTKCITLLENRHLIAASGTTGLRTWEAALHLGQYLCLHADSLVSGRRVLELGAGTGYLSMLCAAHLGAAHVVASDGSDDVVANLPEGAFLNGLQQDGGGGGGGGDAAAAAAAVQPMDLKWGHALVGTEDERWNGGEPVDLVLGADVTYDAALAAPLLATIADLVAMFPAVQVLIAATERNSATYAAFLDAVAMSRDVALLEEVAFDVDGSRGPFFPDNVPIHICRLGRRV